MDTTYKTPEELEKELQIPVLVSMPILYTQKELRIRKLKGILKPASVAVAFFICAFGIVVATKGMDTTLEFAKNLLNKSTTTFTRTKTSLPNDQHQTSPAK